MSTREVVRRLSLAGLTAVLLAMGTEPLADSTNPAARENGTGPPTRTTRLPPCPAGEYFTGPSQVSPAPCLARPSQIIPARDGLPTPTPGYHHLGATTAGEWAGVMGRITVRDPAVRAGTYDFVATRFMAKQEIGNKISWLEVGWAETGWSGGSRQRIYTFDTNRNAWTFYDQYSLHPGEQIWLYLHTGPMAGDDEVSAANPMNGTVWRAWLWWGGAWQLLTAQELALGGSAQLEQYVEVHVDRRYGEHAFAVPPVLLDNVRVQSSAFAEFRPWNQEVPTLPGQAHGRYCLDWHSRFTAWQAGDCPKSGDPGRSRPAHTSEPFSTSGPRERRGAPRWPG